MPVQLQGQTYLSISEAAALLGLTRDQFNHRHCRLRLVPVAARVGTSPLFDAAVLEQNREVIRAGHARKAKHPRRAKSARPRTFRAACVK